MYKTAITYTNLEVQPAPLLTCTGILEPLNHIHQPHNFKPSKKRVTIVTHHLMWTYVTNCENITFTNVQISSIYIHILGSVRINAL